MTIITESGMDFVISDRSRLFYIENSGLYEKLKGGIRTTEYIYLGKKDVLQFVEAKTTFPNSNNKEESKEKEIKYNRYYRELCQKYTDSFNILTASLLGKNGIEDIGEKISAIRSMENIQIRFLLVIKNAEETWLSGVKAELEYRLFSLRKIWKIDVQVLNEELAYKKGIIKV